MEPTKPKLRLLMVDHDLELLHATATSLRRRGFAVVAVGDGHGALRALQRERFDVALLDAELPGIDGLELFQRIKLAYPHLPVILLADHGTIQQALRSSREGVYRHLAKPCDVEHLAATVRQAVRQIGDTRWKPAPPRRAATPVPRDLDPVQLLVIDDDLDLFATLRPVLERSSVYPTPAVDEAAARRALHEQRFDVALLEVALPGTDGLAMLTWLRSDHPLLEVVVLTGYPTAALADGALHGGAFAFLRKPKPPEALVHVIRSAYQLHRSRAEAERASAGAALHEQYPD